MSDLWTILVPNMKACNCHSRTLPDHTSADTNWAVASSSDFHEGGQKCPPFPLAPSHPPVSRPSLTYIHRNRIIPDAARRKTSSQRPLPVGPMAWLLTGGAKYA